MHRNNKPRGHWAEGTGAWELLPTDEKERATALDVKVAKRPVHWYAFESVEAQDKSVTTKLNG